MSTETKQTRQSVSPEDFEKYGDNPMDHPNLAPLIEDAIKGKPSALDTSEIHATNSDLLDEVFICGKKCNAITAGHISLFERVGNPLFDGTTLEPTLGHFLEVLYVLTNEDIPGMVRLSMDLKEWKIEREIWAHSIDIEELRASVDSIYALINESSETLAGGDDSEEDDDDEDLKKNTG